MKTHPRKDRKSKESSSREETGNEVREPLCVKAAAVGSLIGKN